MEVKIIISSEFAEKYCPDRAVLEYHKCPFHPKENIYYAYKNLFGRWVLRKAFIKSIWFTNIIGVQLDNGWQITEREFIFLFNNKQKAIDFCLEKNRERKVKIHNKNLF